jgi:arginine-tRNA-protein transferase
MDAGFRRSGRVFYQPCCPSCRECVPIRVDAACFSPSKSQRRVLRENGDIECRVAESRPSVEKLELYNRYIGAWHGKTPSNMDDFELLFYDSPVRTADFEHRDREGRLLAVGICDLSAESVSSVYFYFEPEEAARSLGVWGALREIDYCQDQGIPYYYLGYWVESCSKMNYKNRFRPAELLRPDGVWREQFT